MRKTVRDQPVEYKMYTGEMKAMNDGEGIVEGILNPIGNIDQGKDRTLTGAFIRTIGIAYAQKKTDPTLDYLWPYLWNHDYDLIPPGGIYEAEEVKQQGTRPPGLFIRTRLNLDYQLGRDMYSSFKMGTLRKQSMGYQTVHYEYVKEGKETVRNLIEVSVLEGSAVVFPMNPLADVTGVKSGIWTPRKTYFIPKDQPTMTTPKTATPSPIAHKAFADEYQQNQIQDWLGGWYSLTSALKSAIMDAFDIGDQPMQDVMAALNGEGDDPGFIQALQDWTQQGMDLCVCDFMDAMEQSDTSSSYMMMSAFRRPQRKEGRSFSQTNLDMIGQHVQSLNTHADQLHEMAADLANATGAQTYVDPTGKPDSADPKTASLSRARGLKHSDDLSTADLEDWKKQLRQARSQTVFTTTLS